MSSRTFIKLCRHTNPFRSRSLTLSRYLTLIVPSRGSREDFLSPLSTNLTEDTTELCGVEETLVSFSRDVEPGCLLLLLAELSLESVLPPNLSDWEKERSWWWAKIELSGVQQLRLQIFDVLLKNLAQPLYVFGSSKWMPSEEHPSGRESPIMRATSSNLNGRKLFLWTSNITSLI